MAEEEAAAATAVQPLSAILTKHTYHRTDTENGDDLIIEEGVLVALFTC